MSCDFRMGHVIFTQRIGSTVAGAGIRGIDPHHDRAPSDSVGPCFARNAPQSRIAPHRKATSLCEPLKVAGYEKRRSFWSLWEFCHARWQGRSPPLPDGDPPHGGLHPDYFLGNRETGKLAVP